MEELRSLVTRSRAGDLDAYGEIVHRFQDMAYGYAYSVLGDFHLSEDAAQEAFIEAYRCLGNLREAAAFPRWFRRIVFKHCDRLARRKEMPTAGLEAAAAVASAGREPSQTAEDREMRDKVLAAIRSLPAQQREVTTLFYINGYSQNDIAEFLEIPAGTVKSRLAASRNRLKERMLNMVEETLHKNAPDERFSKNVLKQTTDIQKLLAFCSRDFVRYRHIIHDLNPPCPEWDKAMNRTIQVRVEGKGFDIVERPVQEKLLTYFVNPSGEISLLAKLGPDSMRLVGEIKKVSKTTLVDWIRKVAPAHPSSCVATDHEDLRDCLSQALGIRRWGEGYVYTVTKESFRERITSEVTRLSADDRPLWQRFVARHPDDPQVNPGLGGSGAVVRDFEFMCQGIPVDYYVTREGGEITGVLTTNPFTDRCDEISTLFVDPEHRRKGLAQSLLSVAAQNSLGRNRQPCYSGGDHEVLDRMLTGIGYCLVSRDWGHYF